jgi:DNA gyrase subunit B
VNTYQDRIEKLGLRKDARVIDALVQATDFTAELLMDKERGQAEVDKMQDYFEGRTPEILDQMTIERHDDPQHSSKKLVIKSEVNGSFRETVIDHEFLSSPEYRDLRTLKESLQAFGPAPYSVKIGDDVSTAHTYQQVLKLALDDAQKGLNIQRYKGLGEMNAEQLWETTMDATRRTLLQVKVQDAVETDGLFALLMGEEVEPRRQFIEKHALAASNLDI